MSDEHILETIALRNARGRAASVPPPVMVREMTQADIEALNNPPAKPPALAPVQRLRHSHHMLARLLAEGRKAPEASLITGYSPGRIGQLMKDPAFQELMAYYSQQVEAKWLDVHERLKMLGMSSVDELQERLESDPEAFSNKELRELAEFALDRSVVPPAGARAGAGGAPPAISITFVSGEESPKGGPIIDLEVTECTEKS